jgi:hypothetical protein
LSSILLKFDTGGALHHHGVKLEPYAMRVEVTPGEVLRSSMGTHFIS